MYFSNHGVLTALAGKPATLINSCKSSGLACAKTSLKATYGRMAFLKDGSEEAEKLMKSLRQKLDEAPVAPKYIGRKIRMPGFVVPLDAVRDGRREFLLVPYFGACIHTPPPPANQIVLVSPHSKLKLSKPLESMDVVWVEGELNEARTQTQSGVSGYSLEAIQIYPYKALHQNKK